MKNFHTQYNPQVKIFNNKIKTNLTEYYFLENIEELGKIKSFNTSLAYINEKYCLKIKYIALNKKLYSKVFPREGFRDKYIFIKIENKLNPTNYKSMKFVLLKNTFMQLNESSLLKKIIKFYLEQIKTELNIDFSVKKRYFYLVKNPFLYPEEKCNVKYNIVDDRYLFKFMEEHENNVEKVKNLKGILPNMEVKIKK